MSIPIFLPSIKRKDMDSVLSCLVSDNLGPGQIHGQFVSKACEYLSMAAGLAFKEYKRTIEMALISLDLPQGAKIILSPLTPHIYTETIEFLGFKPLYIDVEGSSAAISENAFEEALAEAPGAAIIYQNLGLMPNMEKIREFGLPLIEDVSQSIGAYIEQGKAGSFGDLTIIDLGPASMITASGGALLLGKKRKEIQNIKEIIKDNEEIFLLSDVNCALGLKQLSQIELYIEKRRNIAASYQKAVMKSRHGMLQQSAEGEPSFYCCPVLINGSVKDVISYAAKKGIETSKAFKNASMFYMDDEQNSFPQAKKLLLRCLLFPLYPVLSKDSIELIIKALSTIP